MNYWTKNIELLRKRDPALAAQISDVQIPKNLAVICSKSGFPTVADYLNPDSIQFFHSPQDPVAEAKCLLSDYHFRNEDGTILLGFGLGYLVLKIAARKDPEHLLFAFEKSPALFRIALEHLDFSDILSDDGIYFFIGDAKEKIDNHLHLFTRKTLAGNLNKLSHPVLTAIDSSYYNDIDTLIQNNISSKLMSLKAFNLSKETLLKNLFENMPAIVKSSPIDNLNGALKGCPAIVVAAGPSLSYEFESLKKAAGSIPVICVDAALKPLLANGIKPDVAVTCDPIDLNFNKVKGISKNELESMPLVFHPESNTQLVNRFQGPKFITNAPNSFTQWLIAIGHRAMTFPSVQTVSHLAFLLANLMEADPIILVGLDLSFPFGQDHAEGCATTWTLDVENTDFLRIADNDGGQVRTIRSFVSMIHVLENEILESSAHCINVSKKGAKIKGAKWMPLDAALKLTDNKNRLGHSAHWKNRISGAYFQNSKKLITEYINVLRRLVVDIDALYTICREAVAVLEKSRPPEGAARDPNTSHGRQLNALYDSAFRFSELLDTLTDYLPGYMMTALKANSGSGVSPRVDPIDKVRGVFDELNTVLPVLKNHCRRSIDTLTNA